MASPRTLTDVELVQLRGLALDLLSRIDRLDGDLHALTTRVILATPPRPTTFDDEVAIERMSPTFVGELTKVQVRLRVEWWKQLARDYQLPYPMVKARMLEATSVAPA